AKILGVPPPTPEQARIIAHPLTPLLVVAGAGSGKTATMSQRVVHLVVRGEVRPDQVLGLTFTRRATAELDQRVAARLARLAGSGLVRLDEEAGAVIATYNAFAGSLVREHGLRIGVDPDSTLITGARAWQIAVRIVEERTAPLPVDRPGAAASVLLALEGALSENLLTVDEAAERLDELVALMEGIGSVRGCRTLVRGAPEALTARLGMLEAVAAYRDYKRRHALLDFGDQIALGCRIAEEAPEVARQLRERHRAVLLDEFQDTSVAQIRLLSALFAGSGVTAVGDPNQAIYGWRGASAGALDAFHERFNPDGAAGSPVLPLSTAWRNDRAILRAANVASSPLRRRETRPGDPEAVRIPVEELRERPGDGPQEGRVVGAFVQDPLQEARTIAAFMEERWGPDAQMAVLCRTRAQIAPIAEALEERGVPYEVIGLGGMLDVPEVADVRAALTVAADPERGERLMRLLTGQGLGAADLAALAALARDQVRAPRRRDDGGAGARTWS
ncbi:MAG: ATP-dependent helicase, partial [Actinomyces dentalis]